MPIATAPSRRGEREPPSGPPGLVVASRPRRLGGAWPSGVAGLSVIALLATLAWQSGGYAASSHLRAGAIAFAIAGVLLVVRPPRRRLPRPAFVALAALVALTVWTGLSAAWSPTAVVAHEDLQRDLVYVALFGLALIAVARRRVARRVPALVLALLTLVAAYALAGRLLPELVAVPADGIIAAYRLADPLGYWNALGALAALGTVLAIGLAGVPEARPPLRGAAAGAAVLLAVAGYLSLSRGAWIALAAGLLVLLAITPARISVLLSGAVVAGCAGLAVARLEALPALTTDPTAGAGQAEAGRAFLPVLLVAVAAAAGGQVAIALGHGATARRAVRRQARVALVAAVAVAGLAGLALYAIHGTALEGRAAAGVVESNGFVDRQWDDFWNPRPFTASGTDRLTSARGTRGALYRVAWAAWEGAPARGEGAGAFEVTWMQRRTVDEKVRDAHSLYLETLAELGVVGLALLLAFLVAVGAGAVATLRRGGTAARARAAAVAAACVTWAVHAGVDWDWQMPAVTGTALVLAACLCGVPKPRGRRSA